MEGTHAETVGPHIQSAFFRKPDHLGTKALIGDEMLVDLLRDYFLFAV